MPTLPPPIPAPPLQGTAPPVACELGYDYPNPGDSGLGYPYGYGSDICVPKDPCRVDGWLYADWEAPPTPDDGFWVSDGTTLWTGLMCNVTPIVQVGEALPPPLPSTGSIATGIELGIAAVLVVVGGGLRRLAR